MLPSATRQAWLATLGVVNATSSAQLVRHGPAGSSGCSSSWTSGLRPRSAGAYCVFSPNHVTGSIRTTVSSLTAAGFPGFDPVAPQQLLQLALDGFKAKLKKTTILELDTTNPTGRIHNIAFVVKHANAASMKSTFWIHELTDRSLRLQYLQIVLLEFFPRRDGLPGLIEWPHVSINTLTKVSDVPSSYRGLAAAR
jgi:hypothetical protein